MVDQNGMISLYHHSDNTKGHYFREEKFVLSDFDSFTYCLVRIWELINQVEKQYSDSNIAKNLASLSIDPEADHSLTHTSDTLLHSIT